MRMYCFTLLTAIPKSAARTVFGVPGLKRCTSSLICAAVSFPRMKRRLCVRLEIAGPPRLCRMERNKRAQLSPRSDDRCRAE